MAPQKPGRKMNRKGRNEFHRFVIFHEGVYQSEAWRSMDCVARCLFLEIWQRYNGSNNGRIPYSFREARDALHVGARKVTKAFETLEEKGFVIRTYKGAFNVKASRASEWEVTTEPSGDTPAKLCYRNRPKTPAC